MSGENFGAILFTMIVVSLIGGCSYVLTTESEWRTMRACLEVQGYEWRSGDCVRAYQ